MRKYNLYLAWLIATLATLFSLYYSEVLGHLPCKLCWYQRICLFPLAILLFPLIWNRKYSLAPYYLPLPLIGLALSPLICQSCSSSTPLGILSGLTFAVVSFLMFTARRA